MQERLDEGRAKGETRRQERKIADDAQASVTPKSVVFWINNYNQEALKKRDDVDAKILEAAKKIIESSMGKVKARA
jgi:hypothetical protein